MPHPTLHLPNIKLSPTNSVLCGYCGQPLAVTVNKTRVGILGIEAIWEEQERCPQRGVKQTVKLVNVRKKAGALFAK